MKTGNQEKKTNWKGRQNLEEVVHKLKYANKTPANHNNTNLQRMDKTQAQIKIRFNNLEELLNVESFVTSGIETYMTSLNVIEIFPSVLQSQI